MSEQLFSPELGSHHGNILYYINKLPGYGNYQAGGAERHLHHLVTGLEQQYGDTYDTSVFVPQVEQQVHEKLAYDVIAPGQRAAMLKFTNYLYENRDHINIIHFGGTNFSPKWPPYLTALNTFLQKPIICRITSTGRLDDMLARPQLAQLYADQIHTFVSQSPEITDGLIQGLDVNSDQIAEINNGVDTEMFKPLDTPEEKHAQRQELFSELGVVDGGGFVYTNVGRVSHPTKQVDDLLYAWEASGLHEDGHNLVLAGPIDEEQMSPQLQKRYNQFQEGRCNVTWTDALEHNDVRRLLQVSDVFITASECEGFSNTMLEAMACGVPAIGRYGVSGHGKMVSHGETGLYFDGTEMLTHALQVSTDDDFRTYMGTNAREHVQANYSIDAMVHQYHELYQGVLNER